MRYSDTSVSDSVVSAFYNKFGVENVCFLKASKDIRPTISGLIDVYSIRFKLFGHIIYVANIELSKEKNIQCPKLEWQIKDNIHSADLKIKEILLRIDRYLQNEIK